MSEIRALTGLRGIAALIVFLDHLRSTLAVKGAPLHVPLWVERLFLMGGRQVDIFFVLSGFIMAMTYRRWFSESISTTHWIRFLQRRFARIYPLYFVMLLLIVAFVLAASATGAQTSNGLDRFEFSALPAHFLLVQAWGFYDNSGLWNPPAWSISIEAIAYLLFPLLMWSVARCAGPPSLMLVGALMLIGFGLNAVTGWWQFGFGGIARGLSEFTLGCSLLNLLGGPVARWLQSNAGSLAMLAVFIATFIWVPDTGFVIAAVTAPLLLTLSTNANLPARFFGWQPIYFLGEISYSIYLCHFLMSSIAYRIFSIHWMATGVPQTLLGMLGICCFVVAFSTFTYYAIERPCRNLLRDRSSDGRKAA